jgi:hypothetical protein
MWAAPAAGRLNRGLVIWLVIKVSHRIIISEVFGAVKEEVVGGWRRLHNENKRNL